MKLGRSGTGFRLVSFVALSGSIALVAACAGPSSSDRLSSSDLGSDAGGDAPTPNGGGGDATATPDATPDATHADATVGADASDAASPVLADAGLDANAIDARSIADAAPDTPTFVGSTCDAGLFACGARCVAPGTSECGCGVDCTQLPHVNGAAVACEVNDAAFSASVCLLTGACSSGYAHCAGDAAEGCETPVSTTTNCGACGAPCGTLQLCAPNDAGSFSCVSSCPADTVDCNGSCVDLRTNVNNCGACTHTCTTTVLDASATCDDIADAGRCGYTCNYGFTPSGGTCLNLEVDPNNCGAPAHVCPRPANDAGVPQCAPDAGVGTCSFVCNPATPTTCGNDCVNTGTDVNNCGGCTHVCSTTVANANPTCSPNSSNVGTCGYACALGFVACGTGCVAAPVTNALFVSGSNTGSSSPSGSESNPFTTVTSALAAAAAGTTIYVAAGTYLEPGSLVLPTNGVTIQGGWQWSGTSFSPFCTAGTATLGPSLVTIVPANNGSPNFTAIQMTGGTTTLEAFTLTNNSAAGVGQSLFGISLTGGTLTIADVIIYVASGGAGAGGSLLTATTACSPSSDGANATQAGGNGAGAPVGVFNMYGFTPWAGTDGANGNQGHNGSPGGSGTPGTTYDGCAFTQAPGEPKVCGGNSIPTAGQSGYFGCGGAGGQGGSRGYGGGSSVGVFNWGAQLTYSACTIAVGNGGNGGDGATGTGGSGGGQGGPGAATTTYTCAANKAVTTCSASASGSLTGGTKGGNGGAGTAGGNGGGGSGGDAYGVYSGSGGVSVNGGASISVGSAGKGGNQGGGTLQGAAGAASATYP